jgi:hypothetical protein
VTSYDALYEHSVEHWFEIRLLVDESDREEEAEPGETGLS